MHYRKILAVVVISLLVVQGAAQSFPTSRSKYTWPFASWSIWNLPIGANAVYVDAQLGVAQSPGLAVDPDLIFMNPTNPVQPIYHSSAEWTGASRCTPDAGNQVLYSAPMPQNFIVPSDGSNYGAAILLPDNNTFYQTQPLCRCTTTSSWTSGWGVGLNTLDQDGIYGAHGGSGLSAIGGTIRVGELLPGAVIRHALKVNLDANKHYYNGAPCYRWPASQCDNYYQGVYGGSIPQLRPGALLAIPASVNINNMGLQSQAGASLAWTFQNYGGYVADDTYYWDKFTVETEFSPAGDVRTEFKSAYGYAITDAGTPFSDDVAKIYAALAVVDSWDYATYSRVKLSNGGEGAGGGAPRQPWAPDLTATTGPTGPVNTYTIYDDSITSGWSLYSAGSVSSVSSPKYSGTSSEKLVVNNAWDDYAFSHSGFSTSGYTHLHVAILSGQADSICFSVQAFHGTWSSSVPQASLQTYGGVPSSYGWTVYNIPLSYLNPSGATIQQILLQDCSGSAGHTFYIDQLQFTSGPYSSTTAQSSTATAAAATSAAATAATSTAHAAATTTAAAAAATSTAHAAATTTAAAATSTTAAAAATSTAHAAATTTAAAATTTAAHAAATTTAAAAATSTAHATATTTAAAATSTTAHAAATTTAAAAATSTTSTSGTTTGGAGAGTYTIFDESTASGWGFYTAGSVSTYSADKYSGSVSQRLITNAAWQNYDYNHAGFSTAGYQYLHVALKSGQSASVCFEIQAYHGSWTDSIPHAYLSDYGGYPTNTAWTLYYIPLSVLNPTGALIQNILLSDCSGSGGHTFYMDQLQFLTGYTLLDESVASGWTLVSGNGGTVSQVTSQAYSGTHSERLTCSGTWQNYGFYSSGYSLSGKTALHFAMKSGQSTSRCVQVQAFSGSWAEGLPVADLSHYGGYPTSSGWQIYNIPLSVFSTSSIQAILVADCSNTSGNTFYLDQLQIL